ncbi:MAG: GntR family transcriptional regulator [Sporichthyaceae bacterium]
MPLPQPHGLREHLHGSYAFRGCITESRVQNRGQRPVFSPALDRRTPILPASITQRYRRLAESVGLRSTRLHALRHYSASQLVSAGVDIRTVAGRLGHGSGGATTLKVYAGWNADADRRAATTIAGIVPTPDSTKRIPRATYQHLAAKLTAEIESGARSPGEQLPTVVELAAEHNLAPNTAHRAVALLAQRGLISVARGRRAVVLPKADAGAEGASS